MSNEWFQFRYFLIRQDQSAMKVGTDGVLLGAWADCGDCANMLDIGTGTGLIALMLAQRNSSGLITALEIDPAAAGQALRNVAESPWSNRIEVVHADFRNWMPAADLKFDLIVCNPPFFTKALKNPDLQRATARHDDDLPLTGLIQKATRHIGALGKLAMILPAGRAEEAILLAAENGLFIRRRLNVRGNANAPVKRILLEWGREPLSVEPEELIVETEIRGVYTGEYKKLTGEFYLG